MRLKVVLLRCSDWLVLFRIKTRGAQLHHQPTSKPTTGRPEGGGAGRTLLNNLAFKCMIL